MPPMGKHKILTEKQVDSVTDLFIHYKQGELKWKEDYF